MSSVEAPESYLAILASSSEQCSFDNAKSSSSERQTLELLDALAGICVSQAQGEPEVYASAMETSPESCTIFIIGNHEVVPQETQHYVVDICRQLTDVANLVDSAGLSHKPFTHDLHTSINGIYTSVLSFTFDKFRARLTKWNGAWLKRGAEIERRLVDETERNKFQKLKIAFNLLHQLAASFHTTDALRLHQVLATISRSWKLNNPDTKAFIHKLDLLPRTDKTDEPFLIERYLCKILKTHNETVKLISFAVSPRRGHIFRNQVKLVFLCSETRRVELDMKTAINTLVRQMDTIDEDRVFLHQFIDNGDDDQYTCRPHCECTMLATILQRWRMQQRPAPIIGVSKLSCLGCHLFFLAYNKARSQLTETDLPLEFVVTGAHNTPHLPWVSPDLTSIDPSLHAGIQQHLLRLARDASIAHVRARRRCLGSASDWSEEYEVMKVDLSLEDIFSNWKAKMNISS
ncbi:uncharacterized protein EV420DRAFT_1574986 [Desarmillaria tabescens]|uniref:Uncharacterized protein n=1 Tax=Armillaria tabescens TaxID=1929756 RepID=A0AA39JKP6_ARMTA|nr:uncharacterized protein EV420DRAFT_1574986 [Desarmillaria tabescens]KAK0444254.1 hypothetical protein EV420DRAFT_1574986 [Desarmillaria tabescens]